MCTPETRKSEDYTGISTFMITAFKHKLRHCLRAVNYFFYNFEISSKTFLQDFTEPEHEFATILVP